jgi:hypothetical protein
MKTIHEKAIEMTPAHMKGSNSFPIRVQIVCQVRQCMPIISTESGGRDPEDHGPRPAQAKLARPHLNKKAVHRSMHLSSQLLGRKHK